MSYLRYLRPVSMLLISLDCSCLITPLLFSNVPCLIGKRVYII